jgi:FeS assembly SUF system protein
VALIDRLTLDAEELRRLARAGLGHARTGFVGALRTLADVLREEEDVVIETAAVAATAPPGPVAVAPTPVVPEAAAEPSPPDAPAAETPAAGALDAGALDAGALDAGALYDRVIDVLHTIFDPEIPVDIYDLGLIYGVEVRDDASVHVRMTLTSPNCPAAQSLPGEVEIKVGGLDGVTGATVEVVFEPPWTPDLMSEEAKLELNIL